MQTPTHTLIANDEFFSSESWDEIYSKYLQKIIQNGDVFSGRNGETRALFGCSVKVDLRAGFPLTQLRKLPWKNILRELLFDLGTSTNVEALGPAKHFWDFLADENGELGASAYCRQWRLWPPSAAGSEVKNESLVTDKSLDQISKVIQQLRDQPNSRQATVITHNPTAINPACPPCHIAMQFSPAVGGHLDLMVPARSNDMVVGFPLDIARYSLILMVVSALTQKVPRFVYMPSSNSHIYENCYEIAQQLIFREPKSNCFVHMLPDVKNLDDVTLESFLLSSYDPHPSIKIAVN